MSGPCAHTLRQIPSGIWVLGLVSMLMDISSEMVHSLLPMFMVTTLGMSVLVVGLWGSFGPAATFHVGAGFCALTLLMLLWQARQSA